MSDESPDIGPPKTAMEHALECLGEYFRRHTEICGGFWPDWDVIGVHVVIADVDHDDSPELTIIRKADLLRAYRRAKLWFIRGDFESLDEAFGEAYQEVNDIRKSIGGGR